jgi:hypothetical protein
MTKKPAAVGSGFDGWMVMSVMLSVSTSSPLIDPFPGNRRKTKIKHGAKHVANHD